ncbi:MAG: four helix bundle protein [Bacillati bacterium ANGP1]|uniref:Four helix bundle protein n=1 Tax=Candidatus Segetimicrobium genomatis TaxID=2569760 RepID=A0A537LAH4_9BACT|nr:MAG: four helix bundle protein [Terrabacteria group bacterium ANGP1]
MLRSGSRPLFESLEAWKLAHELALRIYRETETFPLRERFGLTQQLRRAATSVPANLAEGCGRATTREYVRFCSIARGSAFEVRYHLRLAGDLGFLSAEAYVQCDDGYDRVGKMVHFLMRSLERQA